MKPKYRSYYPTSNSTLTAIFVMSLATVSTTLAADWVGDTSQDWNNPLNWSGDTAPTGNFIINTAAAGIHPIIDAAPTFTPVDLLIADGGTNAGRLDHRSGSLALANTSASGNWMFVARSANTAVATYNLADTATVAGGISGFAQGSGDLTVGKLFVGGGYYANGGVGTVNINTSGTLTANSTANFTGQGNASIVVGCGTGASGTVNLEAGTVTSAGQVWVGNIGNGVVQQTGGITNVNSLLLLARNLTNAQAGTGSWSVSGTGVLNVENDLVVSYAGNNNAQGTLNIEAGGTVNVGTTAARWMIVNQWDSVKGVVNVNGGTLNLNGNSALRFSTGSSVGASSVTLNSGAITSYSGNGTGTATSGDVDLMTANVNGNNTFNLNGGTLSVRAIYSTTNNGTAVFNFNGGTLKSVGNNAVEPNFVRLEGANQRVNIRDGGAIIDSNDHDLVIGDALQHSDVGGDAAIDGGLTKNGIGKLTLEDANTYTGPTTVNAGRLVMGGAQATSGVAIAADASLGVEEPGVTLGSLTVPSATFGAGATLAIETGSDGTSSEKLIVSSSGALDISNGLSVVLNQDGTTNGSLEGVFEVINYTGFIIGDAANNLTVANPRTGFVYNFVDDFAGNISVEVISFDADSDGLPDDWETANALDPLDDGSVDPNNGADGNPDGDFATNLEEFQNETDPQLASSDPNNTDNDGLKDSDEVTYFGNIAAQAGTDDYDGDLVSNADELYGTPPAAPDNGDSWPDSDDDGMNDAWEAAFSITSNGTTDTDGDGFTDKEEHDVSTDPSLTTGSGISPIWTTLKHRWSFNGDLTDLVGGSDATIVDVGVNGVTLDSTSVTMAGGAKASSDYVKLGENLLPKGTTPVTIELWAKQNTIQNWSRIFDFHTSTGESLMMSWTQGTNNATDRVSWNDSTGDDGISNANQPYGTTDEHHIVLTLEPLAGENGKTRVTVYSALSSAADLGPAQGSFETTVNLVNFVDEINALGYSPWPDNTASATYNEVRIWNGALAGWMAEKMHDLGPDSVTVEDLDGDHLPDAWEAGYAFNATSLTGDDDSDTFSNYAEYVAGSDPTNPASNPDDMDADGLLDSWEITHFGNLDQNGSGDPDLDGLTNEQEETGMTNPNDDEDGMSAAWENFWFGNTTTANATSDTDGDGTLDIDEYLVSQPNNILSTPADVNGDGIADTLQHTLTAGDAAGASSFNAAGNWNDSLAPAAGGTYIVALSDLRTPAADGDQAFAGDKLDLVEVRNGLPKLLIAGTGTIYVSNIVLNGGEIRNITGAAGTTVGTTRVAGGIVEISDAGSIPSHLAALNGPLTIDSVLTGPGDAFLWNDSVIFTAANTHTGNLTNNTVNGLILESTGSLKFVPTTNGVTNAILGDGPVTLDGAFVVDLAGASSNPGDEWDLIPGNGAITVNSTFFVSGFTPDAGAAGSRIWTDGTYQYDEATGILSVPASVVGMEAWIAGFGLDPADQDPTDDPDNDGGSNMLEYVLGRDPSVANGAASSAVKNGANLEVTFQRSDLAMSHNDVSLFVEYGGNLTGWTEVEVPAANGTVGGVSFTITDGSPNDTVVASIPHGGELKFFGRVKAVK